jgi:oxygen-independent coproporphyrinogen-3 oxidase
MTPAERFAKYDIPVPRYTSYPTVPQWHTPPTTEAWIDSLTRAAAAPDAALAVYVHVPFCESLCTFCGCNTVITRDHGREHGYVDLVLGELDTCVLRAPALRAQPFRQIHLGGGTPTFLGPDALARLVDGVRNRLAPDAVAFDGSVEVDPRVTTASHLAALRERGFRRVSLGVQDVDPDVQHLVNRHQTIEQTAHVCEAARALGYDSINVDLIYGLPGQTTDSMATLVREVMALAPDRLAVYSFARVPWIKPAQRRFRDDQVPVGAGKRQLYEAVREPLMAAGYLELGIDHFARAAGGLAGAAADGRLHRNFMGYTEVRTTTLLGLGVSAISDTPDCYHQNEKVLPHYDRRVRAGEIPTLRGHLLSAEDRRRRDWIGALMTSYHVALSPSEAAGVADALAPLAADGFIQLTADGLDVLPEGRPFLRNIAAVFDEYLGRENAATPTYSTSV